MDRCRAQPLRLLAVIPTPTYTDHSIAEEAREAYPFMNIPGLILLFEEKDQIGTPLHDVMSNHGVEVLRFANAEAFLSRLDACPEDGYSVLIDGHMSEGAAFVLLETLRSKGSRAPVVLYSNEAHPQWTQQALNAGATDVVALPIIYAYLMNRGQDFPGTTPPDEVKAQALQLRNGQQVTFRFLHPEDAEIELEFVRNLSDESRYKRFFSYIRDLPAHMLDVLVHNDFPRSYAVIATVFNDNRELQVGVARYTPTDDPAVAEFAVVVADDWQRQGLASKLMHVVILAAALAGYAHLDGLILSENLGMRSFSADLGFSVVKGSNDGPGVIRVRKTLLAAARPSH